MKRRSSFQTQLHGQILTWKKSFDAIHQEEAGKREAFIASHGKSAAVTEFTPVLRMCGFNASKVVVKEQEKNINTVQIDVGALEKEIEKVKSSVARVTEVSKEADHDDLDDFELMDSRKYVGQKLI